ncbi:HET-domain-containing protein [Lentithecium fluviatile CBS 122367]|uniref:HET-domain-containing protein n=1 Tax=Lentithecium fluviatile CBS 122367 TaxID=1168545 RepID=A0A6G1IVC2_9PLEO|nr:HET-domain-containing protein [Lentithecium fluviatile CBS 122367]
MGSPTVINMIKEWIRDCTDSHQSCRLPEFLSLPTRLIDIGDGASPIPRLVITDSGKWRQECKEVLPRYIALSYCWGSKKDLDKAPYVTTTSSTLRDHMQALPMDKLPKTVLDAIHLTRRLELRYLWVDNLCIIQGHDEEAHEDWRKESSRMANVYGGAWLTIVASWARSMHDGILLTRPSEPSLGIEIGLRSLENPTCRGKIKLVPRPPQRSPNVDSTDEPLYYRGWALQERILSTRVLICNRDQLAWECQSRCLTESGFQMWSIGAIRLHPNFNKLARSDPQYFRNTWHCIITEYSHRSITNSSDKLPAIGGLAKHLHVLYPDEYLAGMWKESLLDDLLWFHEDVDFHQRKDTSLSPPRSKPATYRAPSWSWASVDGSVRWPHSGQYSPEKYKSQVLNFGITPQGNDAFGEVSAGYITVRGPTSKVPDTLKQKLLEQRPSKGGTRKYEIISGYFSGISGFVMDVQSEGHSLLEVLGQERADAMDFFLLEIREDIAMILSSNTLQSLSDDHDDSETHCFERVGVIDMWGHAREFSWNNTVCVLV